MVLKQVKKEKENSIVMKTKEITAEEVQKILILENQLIQLLVRQQTN